ncbi:uncharacterized protein C8Q71DRAFT_712854 [Rhodofomes roseus]|uniref:DUF7330 domain-containing protein n=1 Tax=Rhodofomes roseus TaxID=34475 RepID=A0ABQ8K912_9APHY|nr:uncharacterized protein C8Q71DRAFT_712854 [Rhodofomes roseus]KAH9833565.1 hypothetical protein C8Q71DRAFT_712854 [Rhodofomes roseus]
MIIDDEDPASPSKDQQALPAVQHAQDDGPPPAYTAPDPGPSQVIAPVHDPRYAPYDPLLDPERRFEKGEPAGRRFMKAFAVAALIWALLVALTQGTLLWTRVNARTGVVSLHNHKTSSLYGAVLPDGRIIECRTGQSRWAAHDGGLRSMSLEMPMPSDAFYLFARGSYSSGHLNVVHDTDWTLRDTIKIDIQVHTTSPDTLAGATICRMQRKEGEQGLALLTPDDTSAYAQMTWSIKVQLPLSLNSDPLYFPAFETTLPRFTQTFDDMHDDVVFGFLRLASTNGKIHAHSVHANTAELLTSNGEVAGDFMASHLEIVASNQPIKANITIIADDTNNGTLKLKSSNGEIHSTVTLLDAQPASGEGTFSVIARTTNAALELAVVDLPLDADVHVSAKTSQGSATLRLPHTFEGDFQLRTSNSLPDVLFGPGVRDPSGRGRVRRMSKERVGRNRMIGAVGWVGPGVWPREPSDDQEEVRPRQGLRERVRERHDQYLQLASALGEKEGHRDAGVQTSDDDWDVEWQGGSAAPRGGRHLSSSALVVTSNGPALLDLT